MSPRTYRPCVTSVPDLIWDLTDHWSPPLALTPFGYSIILHQSRTTQQWLVAEWISSGATPAALVASHLIKDLSI